MATSELRINEQIIYSQENNRYYGGYRDFVRFVVLSSDAGQAWQGKELQGGAILTRVCFMHRIPKENMEPKQSWSQHSLPPPPSLHIRTMYGYWFKSSPFGCFLIYYVFGAHQYQISCKSVVEAKIFQSQSYNLLQNCRRRDKGMIVKMLQFQDALEFQHQAILCKQSEGVLQTTCRPLKDEPVSHKLGTKQCRDAIGIECLHCPLWWNGRKIFAHASHGFCLVKKKHSPKATISRRYLQQTLNPTPIRIPIRHFLQSSDKRTIGVVAFFKRSDLSNIQIGTLFTRTNFGMVNITNFSSDRLSTIRFGYDIALLIQSNYRNHAESRSSDNPPPPYLNHSTIQTDPISDIQQDQKMKIKHSKKKAKWTKIALAKLDSWRSSFEAFAFRRTQELRIEYRMNEALTSCITCPIEATSRLDLSIILTAT